MHVEHPLQGPMDVLPQLSREVKAGGTHSLIDRVIGTDGDTSCKYEQICTLGSGAFGEASLIRRVADGTLFVAKKLDLSRMAAKDTKYVESEIQCLAGCDHFAVVRYVEDVVIDHFMLIVMEYADAGDLHTRIQKHIEAGRYCDEQEVGHTFVQVAMSIDHVHRRHMLHRDIKGANVLLTSNGLTKLGDFGFSHQYDQTVSDHVAATFCGTPYYLAPEVWQRKKYSKKADVWALGILLFEMMALRCPFQGKGLRQLMESVVGGQVPPLPPQYSPELQGIVHALLQVDPSKRPSTAELFRMPHMVKLLDNFDEAARTSLLLSDDVKQQIFKSVQEIRETPVPVGTSPNTRGTVAFHSNVRKRESNRAWKDRHLALVDDCLVISLTADEVGKPLPVSRIASVVPVPPHVARVEGVFALNTTDARSMWLQAPSRQIASEWIHKIHEAMGVA